ncbi:phosphotransferase [Streptomyces beigongshangae]|uniref:phosphotransferase n=1 Tax=Streptomyces beigongshangae TaxID=2841597 RepID=UPI001C852074|nr:phosphotransferase [Streptomyces sp. REN17]
MSDETAAPDLPSLFSLVENRLGSRPTTELWRWSHLSTVLALELADRRRVVVKIRPFAERLTGCCRVHRLMWRAGLPCAEPLGEQILVGDRVVTIEALMDDGGTIEPAPRSSARSAAGLARFVSLAPAVEGIGTLDPPPPWVWWNHDQGRLWPLPDDRPEDLNEHPGPDWLDDAATRVRKRLAGHDLGVPVVGHCDWEAQNVMWRGDDLYAVHDWDSVVAQPEIVVAGAAAAVHAVLGGSPGETAIPDTARFIDAYPAARGLSWTAADREAAWAAGAWVHCFNAKKAALRPDGGPVVAGLAGGIEERLRRAGT